MCFGVDAADECADLCGRPCLFEGIVHELVRDRGEGVLEVEEDCEHLAAFSSYHLGQCRYCDHCICGASFFPEAVLALWEEGFDCWADLEQDELAQDLVRVRQESDGAVVPFVVLVSFLVYHYED